MKTVKIPWFKTFQYVEVFKITEIKDGCIYKTETTNQYALSNTVLPEDYIGVTVSNKSMVTLHLFNIKEEDDTKTPT